MARTAEFIPTTKQLLHVNMKYIDVTAVRAMTVVWRQEGRLSELFCVIIIIIIINVKINVALSENASRTRYTIKIKLKLLYTEVVQS